MNIAISLYIIVSLLCSHKHHGCKRFDCPELDICSIQVHSLLPGETKKKEIK